MEFRILGPLEVIGPAGRIEIGSGRQRAILAVLILHAEQTVSTERLIDELWGDDAPPSAHHTLEVHVSGLRRAIGPDLIETQPNGYRLRLDGWLVDLRTFDELVAEASRAYADGDPDAAGAGFTAALALWRGPALDDLPTWSARAERARLEERRTLTLERRVDAELAAGRHLELVPDLRRLVAEMPLREAFQTRLMLALYRSGRQAEALDVYRQAREVLDRELGLEPGPELEAMQHAILDHDPSLSRPVRPSQAVTPPSAAAVAPIPAATQPEGSAPHQHATRRTITTVYAEIRGAADAPEPLDPELPRRPPARLVDALRQILELHGGIVERSMGGALIATFGVGLLHEDDALRAVRAAAAMRDRLEALSNSEGEHTGTIAIRVGVSTLEVVTGAGDDAGTLLTGDAVDDAARLAHAAGLGEILLAQATHAVVRWAVTDEPLPAAGAIRAHRLLDITATIGSHPQRFDAPLVGRERELGQITSAFEQAALDQACQLFTLLGPAGAGKSRLVHEFVASVRPRAEVVRGRCPPYGERVAFFPMAESIRAAVLIDDTDPPDLVRERIAAAVEDHPRAAAITDHVAGLVGVSQTPSTGDETFWAVRIFLEAIAARRPLVLVFDDLQWAEPAFLDLIEYVANTSRGAEMLLLCIARPELLDERPGWAGGLLSATTLLLRPLTEPEVSRLVSDLLGGSGAPHAVERKVAEAAEGNPLFVEEYLAMLLDDGVIEQVDGEWLVTTEVSSITTPASIMALLAARLDRLPAGERDVLEHAAVAGKVFSREVLEALVEPGALPELDSRLGSLVRREILWPDRSTSAAEETYRFKHILIRDAAYSGLPKHRRVVLHERLADWLAQSAEGGPHLSDEVIGAHDEQAYRYRTELGPVDDRALEIGRRAASRLADVARRTVIRGDAGVAEGLLVRAAALLPADDRERLLVLVDLVETLADRGDFAAARRTNEELTARAETAGFADLRWQAWLGSLDIEYLSTGTLRGDPSAQLQAAVGFFDAAGDDRALGRVWQIAAEVAISEGNLQEGRLGFQRGLDHSRRAGDLRREGSARYQMAWLDLAGPATVAAAIRTAQGIVAWARAMGSIQAEAIGLSQLARMKAMRGEFDEAFRLLDLAIALYGELGRPLNDATSPPVWTAMVQWLAGDPVAAEQALRGSEEALARLGAQAPVGYMAIELARMLYVQGRFDEARPYLEVPADWPAGREDFVQALRRSLTALILAQLGEGPAALVLVAEAVERAERTGLTYFCAQVLEDQSEVFVLAGRPEEARPPLAKAIALYDRKGVTVLAARARQKQATLGAEAPQAASRTAR